MTGMDDIEISRLRRFGPGLAGEWRSVCNSNCNVLLEGPGPAMESVLRMLRPRMLEPVVWTEPTGLGDTLELPAGQVGTVVLRAVGDLSLTQQTRLLGWLDAVASVPQVVSTSARPLFARVGEGLFDRGLYYRLNTVLLPLDLTGWHAHDAAVPPAVDRTVRVPQPALWSGQRDAAR